MARKRSIHGRQVRARNLCRHFSGTILGGCAKAGLEALQHEHRSLVVNGKQIACGIDLDRCRQPHEPNARRWDYIVTFRGGNLAVGIEVHHAAADQVAVVIEKKEWAAALIQAHCPLVQVSTWSWIASPPEGAILFTPLHPSAHLLAEAGIRFPVTRITLP